MLFKNFNIKLRQKTSYRVSPIYLHIFVTDAVISQLGLCIDRMYSPFFKVLMPFDSLILSFRDNTVKRITSVCNFKWETNLWSNHACLSQYNCESTKYKKVLYQHSYHHQRNSTLKKNPKYFHKNEQQDTLSFSKKLWQNDIMCPL